MYSVGGFPALMPDPFGHLTYRWQMACLKMVYPSRMVIVNSKLLITVSH